MADKYIALPKGVSEKLFDAAIKEFRSVLGEAAVLTSAAQLAPYIKTMMPVPDSEHVPSAALMATTVEQIQKIVGICNQYKVPLWPISTGKNLGYGSAAPAERGQVVLDLKRMNRILEVNKDLAYALVEPGVTYQQLYDHIAEHKLGLWLSVPAPSAIAGPTGNTLDRGVGYTPYGEHFLFACGMEVVLANGEVLRTGMGSLPNSNTWQVFKWGYGPYLDGIFTQSNYGIVTKFGFWLMPAPPVYKPFVIQYQDEGDIVEIVETIRPLRISGVIPNAAVIAHALYDAPTKAKRSDYYTGPGAIPDAAVRKISKDHDLGIWNIYAALYAGRRELEDRDAGVRQIRQGQDPDREGDGGRPGFRLSGRNHAWRHEPGGVFLVQLARRRGFHVVCAGLAGPRQRDAQADVADQADTWQARTGLFRRIHRRHAGYAPYRRCPVRQDQP